MRCKLSGVTQTKLHLLRFVAHLLYNNGFARSRQQIEQWSFVLRPPIGRSHIMNAEETTEFMVPVIHYVSELLVLVPPYIPSRMTSRSDLR